MALASKLMADIGDIIGNILNHGLLNIRTELLYFTFPHEADLLTLVMSHKLTQYALNFEVCNPFVGKFIQYCRIVEL